MPHAARSERACKPAALTLVKPPQTRPRAPRRSALALWHLLSLDAPCVATLWTVAVADAAGLHLPWTAAAAMFAAVWMLYGADRLLDARVLDDHALDARDPRSCSCAQLFDIEERHRFHHRHRAAFRLGIVLASCVLAALLPSLDPHALRLYAVLAALLAAYLLLIHARSDSAHRLPKELAVGVFFPAAVFIPTVARLPQLRPELLPIAALLAALCSLNCLFLYAWEHPAPRLHAHASTRWATLHLTPITLVVAALAFTATAFTATLAPALHRGSSALLLSIAASAVLLLLLDRLRSRLAPVHLRALADLVLLTPLIPLAISRFG
jgi:hypothetical protein